MREIQILMWMVNSISKHRSSVKKLLKFFHKFYVHSWTVHIPFLDVLCEREPCRQESSAGSEDLEMQSVGVSV